MVIDHLDAGGAQTLLVDLVAGLDKLRFDVMVCALRESTQYVKAVENAGGRVFMLGRSRWNPLKVLSLVKLVHREQVDIVHTHLTAARIAGGLAGKLGGAKAVFAHDHSGDEYLQKSPWLARTVLYPLDRLLARYTEKIFVVSKATRRSVSGQEASRQTGWCWLTTGLTWNGLPGIGEGGMSRARHGPCRRTALLSARSGDLMNRRGTATCSRPRRPSCRNTPR